MTHYEPISQKNSERGRITPSDAARLIDGVLDRESLAMEHEWKLRSARARLEAYDAAVDRSPPVVSRCRAVLDGSDIDADSEQVLAAIVDAFAVEEVRGDGGQSVGTGERSRGDGA